MIKNMRSSSLHISISGKQSELNSKSKEKIKKTFEDLFGTSSFQVAEAVDSAEGVTEIIYELRVPVIQDEYMIKEFFENLEVLLDELSEHFPHFTNFRRVDTL